MADMSELFDDMGIDPMIFFMMSGLFGRSRGGGPFGPGMGGMGMRMGGMGMPFVFMGRRGGGPHGASMFYAGESHWARYWQSAWQWQCSSSIFQLCFGLLVHVHHCKSVAIAVTSEHVVCLAGQHVGCMFCMASSFHVFPCR